MKKSIPSLAFVFFFLMTLQNAFALEYGIDRINEPAFAGMFAGKRLAVLTHAAGVSKNGEHLIDLLNRSYNLKKIFAPEHGLRTTNDDYVKDTVDEKTNLPVISLYKQGSRAPRASDLADIDAIVVDLQDVGLRYYTYFSTIAEIMKVSASQDKEVILLDRPNLLGGDVIEGKTLDPKLAGTFTAYHTVPTRHGMTLGELARMINVENKMNVKLTIVPVQGWARESIISTLDRQWIPPSPALTEIEQVEYYALWGSLENFNVAVGRGKTNEEAFKILGAPWISVEQSIALAEKLNAFHFDHIIFKPYSWVVSREIFVGQQVNGIRMEWSGGETRSDELTYKVAQLLVQMFPDSINSAKMSSATYGSKEIIEAIRNNVPWEETRTLIDKEINDFKIRRQPYLLY